MSSTRLRTAASLIGMCLLILGTLFVIEATLSRKPVTMSNVGGQTNECTCTHRLE